MDAENEINAYLRSKGVQRAVLKDMLDGFAHDLAEAIRNGEYPDHCQDSSEIVAMCADLIDPKVP